jgi:hypothetical protein
MADRAKDKSASKADPKKKKEGTVVLTSEELRAISGGAKVLPTQPVKSPDNVIKKP